MGYLKTVLTYDRPSLAEVDKAFLESHGIAVYLMNAETSRNELGAPFFIRLQVMEEDWVQATKILRETNPARFGSHERVVAIDREFKSSLRWFAAGAAPCAALAYMFTAAPHWTDQMRLDEYEPTDLRPLVATFAAFFAVSPRYGSEIECSGALVSVTRTLRPLATSTS